MSDAAVLTAPAPGLFQRAVGIIVSPGATFRTVVASPRPAGILLLACIVISLAQAVPQFTERGQRAALDMQVQQMERFTGKPVAPEQYAQMEKMSRYTRYFTIVGVFVFVPIVCLVLTAVYWAIFNAILGGSALFKQVLGVVTHTAVIAALGALLAAPIQYAQGVQTTSGPFNLGAIAPMLDPGSFLFNLLSGISFFTLWQLVVTAIGLGVLYRRKSTGIAIALLTAYVLIASAVTAALSSFAGR
jgi:hypothetical protein